MEELSPFGHFGKIIFPPPPASYTTPEERRRRREEKRLSKSVFLESALLLCLLYLEDRKLLRFHFS